MAEMSSRGRFVWYDLMTTDPAKAQAVLHQGLRLGHAAVGEAEAPYTMWTVGEQADRWRDAAAEPGRAAALARVHLVSERRRDRQAGGVARREGLREAEGHPRTSAASPSLRIRRAPCSRRSPRPIRRNPKRIRRSASSRGTSWPPPTTRRGFDFYEKLFGWEKREDHDMGPMGVYRLFGRNGQ